MDSVQFVKIISVLEFSCIRFACHHLAHTFRSKAMWRVYSDFFFVAITARQWLFIDLLLRFIRLQLGRNAKQKI